MTGRTGQVTVPQNTPREEGKAGGEQEGEGTTQAAGDGRPTDPHATGHGSGRRHGVMPAVRDSICGTRPGTGTPTRSARHNTQNGVREGESIGSAGPSGLVARHTTGQRPPQLRAGYVCY